MASARPSAQAASTLPPTYSIEVCMSPTSLARSSMSAKWRAARTSKLVTMRLPASKSTLRTGPAAATGVMGRFVERTAGLVVGNFKTRGGTILGQKCLEGQYVTLQFVVDEVGDVVGPA